MPLWGTQRWHHAKWGALGLPAPFALWQQLWSNPHPWAKRQGLGPYSRSAEWAVYAVDATTLANGQRLPRVAGGSRESNWEDVPLQTETLTLQFMNPDEYLPGGAYHDLVELGRLLRVEWTTRVGAASGTVGAGLYRVTATPQVALDESGAQPPQCEAEGWLEDPLRKLMLDGGNPLGDAVKLRDAGIPLGMPMVWGADTYATLVAALIWTASGHRLRVPQPWRTLNYWGTSSPSATTPPPPAPAPQPPATAYTAQVSVTPTSAFRGTTTHFQITFAYSADDYTADDQLFIGPAGLTAAQASVQAASLPADDPHLCPVGQAGANGQGTWGIDIALDFGSGIAAQFWYRHRIHGCVPSPATCGLT